MAARQGQVNAIELGRSEPGAEPFLTAREARGAGGSTLRNYANHLGMVRRRSPKPLLQLTDGEATALAAKLARMPSGYSLSITVRMFYAFHKKADHAKAFLLRKKKKRLAPADLLMVEDVNRMIGAARYTRDKALLAVLWETGGRIHEVLALTLADVEKPNGYYKVFFRKVKVEGEEHSCILTQASDLLEAWLKAYPLPRTDKAPLFPSADHYGYALSHHGARFILLEAAKVAQVTKPVNPHAFRHGRATDLLRRGMSEAQVKRFMGWTPASLMLGRYSHLVDEDVDNAILESHGLKAQEKREAPVLAGQANGLGPAMPVDPEAMTDRAIFSDPAQVAKLLSDPNVQAFLRLLSGAQGPPAARASPDAQDA